jgi:hypothetical protein
MEAWPFSGLRVSGQKNLVVPNSAAVSPVMRDLPRRIPL